VDATVSQAGYTNATGGSRNNMVPDLLAAFLNVHEASKEPNPSLTTDHPHTQGPPAPAVADTLGSPNMNHPLEWPLHSSQSRGYTASSNTEPRAAEDNMVTDWFDFLSGTSTAVSTSGANAEYTHLHSKLPNRLPTPTSPPNLVSGGSHPNLNAVHAPGHGVPGQQFIAGGGMDVRWMGEGEDRLGQARGLPTHSGKERLVRGDVHVKEEEGAAV
jgi:hypothetical protein